MLGVPAKSTINSFFPTKTSGSTKHNFVTPSHRPMGLEQSELLTHNTDSRMAGSREFVTRQARQELSFFPVLACALANL